uniref:Tail protein n=1 Tax=Pseudomonas phage HRDY3 TaxID=3236930 RepID=A0AB39CDZ0_9VIRU
MATLTEFIDDKIAIALNYRGLSKFNPVEIIVEGNGKKFVVLVSLLEPDTLTVPYNVTWINADPNHEDYKVLMRRVDAEKYDDKDYRGSWSVLSSVEEIFTEEQYFKKKRTRFSVPFLISARRWLLTCALAVSVFLKLR